VRLLPDRGRQIHLMTTDGQPDLTAINLYSIEKRQVSCVRVARYLTCDPLPDNTKLNMNKEKNPGHMLRTYYPYICDKRSKWNDPQAFETIEHFYLGESETDICNSTS
jgi:hypothetical protein